jgi:hypothetical protein
MDVLECRMSVAYLIDWLSWLREECTKGAGDVMAANQVCVTVAELAAVRSFHSIKCLSPSTQGSTQKADPVQRKN